MTRRLAAAGHAAVGIELFRPNIVLAGLQAHDEDRLHELRIATAEGEVVLRLVKPCPRCPIPNVDPATGETSPEVLAALSSYRASALLGGAIAFGHPLASSGIRLMTQLARQFEEQPHVRYGLTTMCVGFGMGATVIWENPHFEGDK